MLPTATIEAAFPTATPTSHPAEGGDDNGKCELLGPFALLVQVALGALALLSLVYKRSLLAPTPMQLFLLSHGC